MSPETLLLAGLTDLLMQGLSGLANYIHHMNVWQWGVLSSCGVVFGFLCLKGSNIA